jgi:Ca-activated chloride channel homolog
MIEFSAPIALLALLSVPAILYLYRLRPRRRQRTIASLELWREALRRRRPSAGLARLLRNFSLLLLLMTGLLLALSLADPKWLETQSTPAELVMVVDTSASMQSRAGTSTRFALAIDSARQKLAARPEGARTALISSAWRARLEVPFTTQRNTLDSALTALRAVDETGQPERALELAASLQTQSDTTHIVLLTDGAFAPSVLATRRRLDIIQVGETRANIGITRFQVRAHPRIANQFVMFARLQNFTEEAIEVPGYLDVAGTTVQRFEVEIPARSSSTVNASFTSLGGERTTLVLEHADALAVDNQAYAVLPTRAPILVSVPGKLLETQVFLASALDAMPHIGVMTDTAEGRARGTTPARRRPADIVVATEPGMLSTSGNFLLFGARAAQALIKADTQVSNAGTVPIRNPLFAKGLDLSGIRVGKATVLQPIAARGYRYESVLRVDEGDIAAALLGANARVVVFGFDPGDTSLPLRPAWPILLDETLTWLAGQHQSITTTAIQTGHGVRLAAGTVSGKAELTTPSGRQRNVDILEGEIFVGNAPEAGFYTVTTGNSYRPFAANLTAAEESDIRPQLRTTRAASIDRAAQSEQATTLWPWLLLLALAALAWETSLRAGLRTNLRALWYRSTPVQR